MRKNLFLVLIYDTREWFWCGRGGPNPRGAFIGKNTGIPPVSAPRAECMYDKQGIDDEVHRLTTDPDGLLALVRICDKNARIEVRQG